MSMVWTRERGLRAGKAEARWLNALPDERFVPTVLTRLDGELAAFCRGYLDGLIEEAVIDCEDARTIGLMLKKPHWEVGWFPR